MGKRIFRRWRFALLAGFATIALTQADVLAGISIVRQSADIDRVTESAHFSITFNQPPDFSPGPGGFPLHSFQYEIAGNWTHMHTGPLAPLTSVVRGDEISIADALRVRSGDFTRPDADPAAGGWGPVLGTVPFQLSGNTLTFDAPLTLIGDDNGVFAYNVYALNSGTNDGIIQGHVVPLPMGALTGGIGVAALAAMEFIRRRRMDLA